MDIETARFNMIEQQIRPWEGAGPRAVAAGHRAARGLRAAGHAALAFVDTQVPLLPGSPTARACWSRASKPACCRS
jgi:hypothetical protein